MSKFKSTMVLVVVLATALSAWAQEPAAGGASAQQDQAAELAKKAQNPVADLMIMPLQYNIDFGIGPADASQQTLKFMPVIPFSLGPEWNLITRTIIPWIDAESPVEGGERKSPAWATSSRASSSRPKSRWVDGSSGRGRLSSTRRRRMMRSAARSGAQGPRSLRCSRRTDGPMACSRTRSGRSPGNDDRANVNVTFLQPFLAKTTKTYTTLSVNTESIYDWQNSQWTVPINISIGQMIKIGNLPISLELGYRYYLEKPDGGPDWGLRFFVKFLFPK